MKIILQEQRINHRSPMLDQLRIFCKMAVRGVLSRYNGQTQAEGYLR